MDTEMWAAAPLFSGPRTSGSYRCRAVAIPWRRAWACPVEQPADHRLRPIVSEWPHAPFAFATRCGPMEKRVPSRRGRAPSPETPPPRTVAITSNRPMAPAVSSGLAVLCTALAVHACAGEHSTPPHHTPACSQGAQHANHSQLSVHGCAGKTHKRLPARRVGSAQRHAT